MLTKEQVLESIEKMPEEKFEDLDVLLERLVILDKIQTGIEQADRGQLTPIEDVMKQLKEKTAQY